MSRAAPRVEGVVRWSGDVELGGECVIAPSAILSLAPGCRVAAAAGGAPPLLIVQGTLLAQGRVESPVNVDVPIRAAGGWVRLTNCRLNGRGGEGLHLYGDGHLLDGAVLTGFETGLFLRDGEVCALGVSISSCVRPLVVGAGGRLRARELTIAAGRTAAVVETGGSLVWEGGAVVPAGDERPLAVVHGEFVARGVDGAPLTLHLSLATDGGRADLTDCRLEGRGGEGLTLRGAGHRLSRVTLTGFERALAVRDGSAIARDLTIAGERTGLEIGERGRLDWERGAISSSGSEPGRIVVKGELAVRGAAVRGLTLITDDGGRVELADCRLEGRGGEGLTLRGGGHRLERVTLTGFSCGLSARGGETRARELTALRCEAAAVVGAGGLLAWDGGGARDGGAGALVSSGGRAFLRGLLFEGLRRGVRVEDGTARIDGLECRGLSGPAVELQGDSFAGLHDGRAPGGELLAAASGHAHLSGSFQGRVRASPQAGLCVAPESVALEKIDALRGFVLKTGGGLLGVAYKAAAAAAVSLFSAWARRQPGLAGAWAHRSWVAGGWEPGASDIDLALSVEELSSARARTWLADAQAAHARARRLFPALGELLIAEDAEWRETAAAGLPRPGEWRVQARLLAGRLPEVPQASPVAARLGARLEGAMAYSRLMDVCFHPEMAEELARREAAKAVVDLLRYRSPEGERGRALPREEFRAGLASTDPEWRERLRALAAPGRAHRAACALAAAAARHWGGRESASAPPGAERARADDGPELRRALEGVDEARRDFGGAAIAAVFDTLHRSYLIVDPSCSEETLAAGIASWARRAAALGARPTLPVVLTRPGWALWRGTAYHDFPLQSAAWPGPGGSVLEKAGRDFPGGSRVFWGDYSSPRPPAEESAAALKQALAQFRVTRRLFVGEARATRAAAHHLLVRAAGLGLAGRGLAAPDFDSDAAFAAVESFAPRAAAGLCRAASGDWSGFEPAADELLPSPAH